MIELLGVGLAIDEPPRRLHLQKNGSTQDKRRQEMINGAPQSISSISTVGSKTGSPSCPGLQNQMNAFHLDGSDLYSFSPLAPSLLNSVGAYLLSKGEVASSYRKLLPRTQDSSHSH